MVSSNGCRRWSGSLDRLLLLDDTKGQEVTLKLKMNVDVPENLLSEILVTAFDGDDGGSRFWSEPHPNDDDDDWIITDPFDDSKDPAWKGVRIRHVEQDEDDPTFWTVSWGTLVQGMQNILDGDFSGHQGLRKLQGYIQEAVIEDDGGQLDTNAVDTIVQYGLFGNEQYS